ncbi:hypothetical protein LNKW23_06320 [Paralimibaculum aggregatum]|uniref:Sel1 repeat family protein n=2 Tax=Paralimibaculum aggregatum TaxID=3036245 RepID=A0ABQ6LL88_9RHOB|nr:hypothetical protein LNKW23_06320 [Limibaculum sp. NKW23]
MTALAPALLAAILAAGPAAALPAGQDSDPGASCDRLAATNDGSAPVPPVKLAELNAPAAASACRAAIRSSGARPRHHLQLARALLKLGQYDEARAHLVTAAARGNAAAYYILGQLHHTGTGVDRDTARAHALYLRALEAGYREAAFGLLALYRDPGSGLYDPEEAEAARLYLYRAGIL